MYKEKYQYNILPILANHEDISVSACTMYMLSDMHPVPLGDCNAERDAWYKSE